MTPLSPLSDLLDDAWSMLARGVDDPADDLHWPVLATVGQAGDGAPFADARTVVLRASDRDTGRVAVHSDADTGKIAQLRANPSVALVAYHRPRRIQLRLHGVADLHVGDAVAAAAWTALPGHSRALYAGPERFCVIRLRILQLDWLHIGPERPLRAAFTLGDGPPQGRWIDP